MPNTHAEVPEEIVGSEFLDRYKTHDDPVTTIQPDARYRVAGPTRHPIEENERVLKFIDALARRERRRRTRARRWPASCMYGAHESYRDNCRLSVEEVDFLVEAVRARERSAAFTARRSPAAAPAAPWRCSAGSTRSESTFPRSPPNTRAVSGRCRTSSRARRPARSSSARGAIVSAPPDGSALRCRRASMTTSPHAVVRKGVVPMAGLGTRFFPASHA